MATFSIGAWVAQHYANERYEFGYAMGQHDSSSRATRLLREEFGEYQGDQSYVRLFSFKTSDVVSTEVDGVRTVRVIP